MLTLAHALTWPKFIGITVGLLGLGSLLSAIGAELPLSLFTHPLILRGAESWFAVGASALFVALGCFLYRGHDWARRVLVCLSLLLLAGLVVIFVSAVLRRPAVAYDGPESAFTPEVVASFRRQELVLRFTRAGEALCAVTVQGFLTLGLLHADVVRAFRPRATPDEHECI